MSALTDAKFLGLTSRLRRSQLSEHRPKTPEVTPGVAGGIAGGAILCYLTLGDSSEWVRLAGVVSSAVVLCVSAWAEARIRGERNATEQTRIQSANEPNVLITDNPHDVADGLENE